MSRFVLDTDIATLYSEGNIQLTRQVLSHRSEEIAVSVITVEEQLSGWYRLLRRKNTPTQLAHVYSNMAETVTFLGRLQILSFTEPAIARYETLKAMKLGVGGMDLRIAAIVLEHRAILVTRNIRDFKRIPGLIIEDWTK